MRAEQVSMLRNATLPDGSVADLGIDGTRVASLQSPGSGRPAHPGLDLDLRGHVVLPAFTEPHIHLDKVDTWDAIEPPVGDLGAAIGAWLEHAATMTTDDVITRATAHVRQMLSQGTTAIRTHVDLLDTEPIRSVRALAEVRTTLGAMVDLQMVALAYPDTPDQVIVEALAAGADLVGGAPHLADNPHTEVRRLVTIAQRHGIGADLHMDETLEGHDSLLAYARLVAGEPAGFTAGHCVLQGTLPDAELAPIVAQVHAARMGIVTLPITNLYLQGRDQYPSTPRGLTAVRAWLDAGVPLAAGADNVRDPFNPMGRGDPLETASLLVTAGHLSIDEALRAVTTDARRVLGLEVAGPVAGAVADLVVVRAGSVAAAMAAAPVDRFVIRAGRLVARRTTHCDVATLFEDNLIGGQA
jgi:cytosine deaminase